VTELPVPLITNVMGSTAAEIGELGDNTARLRAQIRDDELLHLALRAEQWVRGRCCRWHDAH